MSYPFSVLNYPGAYFPTNPNQIWFLAAYLCVFAYTSSVVFIRGVKYAIQAELRMIPEYDPWSYFIKSFRETTPRTIFFYVLAAGIPLMTGLLGYWSGRYTPHPEFIGRGILFSPNVEYALGLALRMFLHVVSLFILILASCFLWTPVCREPWILATIVFLSAVVFFLIGHGLYWLSVRSGEYFYIPKVGFSLSILAAAIFWARRQGEMWFRLEQ